MDLSKVFIVAGNWVFHQINFIKQFLTQVKLRRLFIPHYSPEMIIWEKLINFIKSKMKMIVNQQRLVHILAMNRIINLKSIEMIADSVDETHWVGFVKVCVFETMELLRVKLNDFNALEIVHLSCAAYI